MPVIKAPGGFRFLSTDGPFSAGVAAEPGFQEAFDEFNVGYVAQHDRWGLRVEGQLAAARTNVAPEIDPPNKPSLHAFCHTVEGAGSQNTFVISGAPEAPGTKGGLAEFWKDIATLAFESLGRTSL